MSDPEYDVTERSVHINMNNQEESNHPLLSSKRFKKMMDRKTQNKVFAYFCIGFILSAAIALIAYHSELSTSDVETKTIVDKPPTSSSISKLPITITTSSTSSELSAKNAETTTEITVVDTRTISTTTQDNLNSSTSISNTTTPFRLESCEKRIVAHETAWDIQETTEDQLAKLTHYVMIVDLFLPNGTLYFNEDLQKKKFERMYKKTKSLKVKTMFQMDSDILDFADCSDSDKRAKLIDPISAFLHEYDIDGIEILLYSPINKKESAKTILLFKELREKLSTFAKLKGKHDPYIISAFCKSDKFSSNLNEIMEYLDFVTIRTSDYCWSKLTSPSSPLYSGHRNFPNENVDSTMKMYSCKTKNPNKLNMMVTFNGNNWNNVTQPNNSSNKLRMTTEMTTETCDQTYVAWKDMKKEGWDVSTALWNDETKTPYISNSEKRSFLAFENERSLKEKIKYAIDKNIGGFTIEWLESDDNENTLLNVVSSAKLCSGEDNTLLKYNCD